MLIFNCSLYNDKCLDNAEYAYTVSIYVLYYLVMYYKLLLVQYCNYLQWKIEIVTSKLLIGVGLLMAQWNIVFNVKQCWNNLCSFEDDRINVEFVTTLLIRTKFNFYDITNRDYNAETKL